MNLITDLADKFDNNRLPLHVTTIKHESRCRVYGSLINPTDYNKNKILEYIDHLYSEKEGKTKEQLICWQSKGFLHKQTEIFGKLTTILNDKVNYFTNLKHGYRLHVSEMWAAIYKKGDYAKLHGHGKYCQFSGVLYLNSKEGHPGIIFEDNFALPATENTAYFFDSNYRHSVPVNSLDSLRIVLGFNFYLALPDQIEEQ